MEKIKKLLNRVTTVLTIFCVVICLVVCTQVITKKDVNVMGFSLFHILTGSMEPTIKTGGLVVVRQTGFYDLEVGDIITFRSRNSVLNGAANTHRIIAVDKDENGQMCLVTKGDANNIEDEERVYPEDIIGKVVYYGNMNGFTTFLNFVRTLPGFLTVVVMPLMLVAFWIMQSFKKEMDRILKQRVLDELEKEEAADEKASVGAVDGVKVAAEGKETVENIPTADP